MANQTLIIDNIDLDMLEDQRFALLRVITECEAGHIPDAYDTLQVEGILAMLDYWADVRDGYVK